MRLAGVRLSVVDCGELHIKSACLPYVFPIPLVRYSHCSLSTLLTCRPNHNDVRVVPEYSCRLKTLWMGGGG